MGSTGRPITLADMQALEARARSVPADAADQLKNGDDHENNCTRGFAARLRASRCVSGGENPRKNGASSLTDRAEFRVQRRRC